MSFVTRLFAFTLLFSRLLANGVPPRVIHSIDPAELKNGLYIASNTTIQCHTQVLLLQKPIVVAPHVTLTISQSNIIAQTSGPCFVADETSTVILESSTITLLNDTEWPSGKLKISSNVIIFGPFWWKHSGPLPCEIEAKSSLTIDGGATFYFAPIQPSKEGIHFANKNAVLHLHNGHLRSGEWGLTLHGGTLLINGQCTAHAENNEPHHGISLGTGEHARDNMTFSLLSPDSVLKITSPFFNEKKSNRSLGHSLLIGARAAGIALALYLIYETHSILSS